MMRREAIFEKIGIIRLLIATLCSAILSIFFVLPSNAQEEIKSFVSYFSGEPAKATSVEVCTTPGEGGNWRDGTYRIIIRDRIGTPATLKFGVKITGGAPTSVKDFRGAVVEKVDDLIPAAQARLFSDYPNINKMLPTDKEPLLGLLSLVCSSGSREVSVVVGDGKTVKWKWSPLNLYLNTVQSDAGFAQVATQFEIVPMPNKLSAFLTDMEIIRGKGTPVPKVSILGVKADDITGDDWLRPIFLSFPDKGKAVDSVVNEVKSNNNFGIVNERIATGENESPASGSREPEFKTQTSGEGLSPYIVVVVGVLIFGGAAILLYSWQTSVARPSDGEHTGKYNPTAQNTVIQGLQSKQADTVAPIYNPEVTLQSDVSDDIRRLSMELEQQNSRLTDWVKYFEYQLDSLKAAPDVQREVIQDMQARLQKLEQAMSRLSQSNRTVEREERSVSRVPSVVGETRMAVVRTEPQFETSKAGFLAILDEIQAPREAVLALNVTSDLPGLYQWLFNYLLAPGQSRARYRDVDDRLRSHAIHLRLIIPDLDQMLDDRLHEPVGYIARAGLAQQIVELVQPGLYAVPEQKVLFKARVHVSN